MEKVIFKRSFIGAAVLGAMIATAPSVAAENPVGKDYEEAVDSFVHDATFTGAAVVDTRYRGRSDADGSNVHSRLNYSSYNVLLNFNSGYHDGWLGIDLGGFFSGDLYNDSISDGNGNYLCNEISMCQTGDWSDGSHDFKPTTVAIKLKPTAKTDAQVGFIQGGVGTIGNNWSFAPSTYRGFKINHAFDNGMTLGYMGADEAEAPWLHDWKDAKEAWYVQDFQYLHSIGLSGTAGKLTYNLGVGQALGVDYNKGAKDSQDNYSYNVYAKYALTDAVSLAYNMYGVDDEQMYNGFAAHHGAILDWAINSNWGFTSQVQYTQMDDDTAMGEFAPRTMARYGSNNGVYALWWDALSDWNMPGEVAWYNRLSYDTGSGWKFNLGAGYGGGADKSPAAGFSYESEWAVNADVMYTISTGALKGTLFKLHATHLERDAFEGKEERNEQDLRFIVIAPFSFF